MRLEARREAGALERLAKLQAGVAALMVVGDVMRAPHPRRARHGDEDPPARRELGPQIGERLDVLRNMFEHVEQHDQVIGAIVERHMGQIAALDRQPAALFGEGARIVIGLDRIDRAEALQQSEIGAGAGAHFEDAERTRLRTVALDQRGNDLAARDEPPMVLVDLGHPVIGGAVHQARSLASGSGQPIRSRTM